MDYWTEKLSLLPQAGYQNEADLYYEIWFGLPRAWKENIPMHGSLDTLRTTIREREVARGRWPATKTCDDKSDSRSTSSDSGYSSTNRDSSKKRGGGFIGGGGKRSKDSKDIPSCRICQGLGKPDQKHWHVDCPNNDVSKPTRKLNAIQEEDDSSNSDEDPVPKQNAPSDSSKSESISRVYSTSTISAVKADSFQPSTFPNPKIFPTSRNNSVGVFGSGNIFKAGSAVNVYIRFTPESPDVRVCCDSGCGPTIGNRKFILDNFPEAVVEKRNDDVKLRVQAGFQKREYEVLPDYVALPVYMVTNHGNLLELLLEIHLCDSNVESGVLIGSTALKHNRIIADFDKEVLVALDASPNNGRIQVPMYFTERRKPVNNVPVKAGKDMSIPAGHKGLVPVDLKSLPDRDVLFTGKDWFDRNGLYGKAATGVANASVSRLVVGNFGDKDLKIKRGETIGYLSNTLKVQQIKNCYNLNTEREYLERNLDKLPSFDPGGHPKTHANQPGSTPLHAKSLYKFLTSLDEDSGDDECEELGISLKDLKGKPVSNKSVRFKTSDAGCAQGEFATSVVNSIIQEINQMVQDDCVIKDRWKFSKGLSKDQVQEMLAILRKYKIWDGIGCLNTGDYLSMPLKDKYKDATSVQKPYDMSPLKRKHYDDIIKELERQGIVEDSKASKYCSPALIVIRKGRPRFVIDFRKINEMCQQDYYPLPRQADIFAEVEGAEYISLLDLKKAFYQLPIEEEYRDLTTFSTKHGGAKRLTRSTMGYLNSPSHCQRIIDRLIKPYRWKSIIVYMDDILIYSRSWQEHLSHLDWLLSQIQRVGLTLDPEKAYLGFKSINLLGHVVGKFGLATQQQKVEAMTKLRRPNTVRDGKSMLNFFGYYRQFIRSFAQIAAPLTQLLQNKTAKDKSSSQSRLTVHLSSPVQWGKDQEEAFQTLKTKLSEATELAHPQDTNPLGYCLYIDGSKLGLGAALHIVLKKDNLEETYERPISFISRSLKSNERRYWPTELEMLGLTWALKRFEEIVEGRPLKIYTDHSALTWLFSASRQKSGNQRLLLWSLQLHSWKRNATIIHRPGRAHINADILSRYPIDQDTPKELLRTLDRPEDKPPTTSVAAVSTLSISPTLSSDIIDGYSTDPHWSSLYAKLQHLSSNAGSSCEYHNFRYDLTTKLLHYIDPSDKSLKLCIPNPCVLRIFQKSHDDIGHLGFTKIYQKISESFHIDRLSKRLKEYVNACPTCTTLRNKDHRNDLLRPLQLPKVPCDSIALDFVTGLPKDEGFDSFLTITDRFTKYVTLIPNHTTDRASDIADLFFAQYYPRFGLPTSMVSDRDPKFISKFWKTLFERLKVDLLMSTSYAPQTDGQSERTNQTVENMLRAYIGYDKSRSWSKDLKEIEFTINSHRSESSDASPFQMLYGFNPKPMWTIEGAYTDGETEIDLITKRNIIRQEALQHLAYARTAMARKYDDGRHERIINVGDQVYIENRSGLSIPGLTNTKMGPKRFGPFTVKSLVGKGAVKLDLPNSYRMHDTISRRHITVAKPDPYNRIPERPPAVVQDDESEEYEVEAVLDERQYCKRKQYLIKWLGYPAHESTWVDESESATFPDALKAYQDAKIRRHRISSRTA